MSGPDDASTAALLDGRYQLGECVGQGGMARVYRAEDVLLGRTVAIKMMRTDADELTIPPRARMEMALLASLNHPSLVTLFDASIVPGRPEYLVMEFVEGRSLAHALHESPLDPSEVAGVAGELASALHVVHTAGIVHRDVKPSNVLLAPTAVPGRRYWAKLADFGVAYLADSTRLTSPGMVMGTAAYLAPEQVRGEAAGAPADVYALGLLLLEALTGERAFPQASGIGQVMARLVESPEVPEWVGAEWSGLLRSMIARDAAARPTALEVARAAARLPHDIRRPSPTPPTVTAIAPATTIADAASTTASDDRAARAAALGVETQAVQMIGAPGDRSGGAAVDAATRALTAPVTRHLPRSPRPRTWWIAGAAAATAASLILAGNLWAGGLPGGGVAELETPGATAPAPSIVVEEVADEEPPTGDTVAADPDDTLTDDAETDSGAEEARKAADNRAAKEAAAAKQRAIEAAEKEAARAAKSAEKRAEQAAENAGGKSGQKGSGGKKSGD